MVTEPHVHSAYAPQQIGAMLLSSVSSCLCCLVVDHWQVLINRGVHLCIQLSRGPNISPTTLITWGSVINPAGTKLCVLTILWNFFWETEKYVYIFLTYLNTKMLQVLETLPHPEKNDMFIVYSQYHGCWCLGDARNQGICSHRIDQVIPEYAGFGTRRSIHIGSQEMWL